MGDTPCVAVIDAPGGGYVDQPDVEAAVLAGLADVRLEVIGSSEHDRLLNLDADYAIVWHRVSLDAAFFEHTRRCRAVVCASVGFDHVDLAAARAAGIPVFHIPDYGTEEVADHTLALVLALARALPDLQQHVRNGGWDWRVIGAAPRLRDRMWGVVGLGRIGSAVVRRAEAFGMHCAFHDPYAHPGIEKALGIRRFADLGSLMETADIVSVHVPLNAETGHLLGATELARMKPGSILANTARGAIVDLDALQTALDAGRPALVGLDVVEGEPQIPDWLREDVRALVTPHAAFYSVESLAELRNRSAQAVAQLIAGLPVSSALPTGPP